MIKQFDVEFTTTDDDMDSIVTHEIPQNNTWYLIDKKWRHEPMSAFRSDFIAKLTITTNGKSPYTGYMLGYMNRTNLIKDRMQTMLEPVVFD